LAIEITGLAQNEMRSEHNMWEAETEIGIHRFVWEYNTETVLALLIISTNTLCTYIVCITNFLHNEICAVLGHHAANGCVITQKSADLIYFLAEVSNHACCAMFMSVINHCSDMSQPKRLVFFRKEASQFIDIYSLCCNLRGRDGFLYIDV